MFLIERENHMVSISQLVQHMTIGESNLYLENSFLPSIGTFSVPLFKLVPYKKTQLEILNSWPCPNPFTTQ